MTNIYKSNAIYEAYCVSNILIGSATEPVDNFDTLEFWLASMGMYETLIIMGADASIWEDYAGMVYD